MRYASPPVAGAERHLAVTKLLIPTPPDRRLGQSLGPQACAWFAGCRRWQDQHRRSPHQVQTAVIHMQRCARHVNAVIHMTACALVLPKKQTSPTGPRAMECIIMAIYNRDCACTFTRLSVVRLSGPLFLPLSPSMCMCACARCSVDGSLIGDMSLQRVLDMINGPVGRSLYLVVFSRNSCSPVGVFLFTILSRSPTHHSPSLSQFIRPSDFFLTRLHLLFPPLDPFPISFHACQHRVSHTAGQGLGCLRRHSHSRTGQVSVSIICLCLCEHERDKQLEGGISM